MGSNQSSQKAQPRRRTDVSSRKLVCLFVLGFSNYSVKFWPEVNTDVVFHGILLHMAGHIHKRKSSTGPSVGFFHSKECQFHKHSFLL